MDDQEREQLAASFEEMSGELEDINKRLNSMERNYPGLLKDGMFSSLVVDALACQGNASGLADYIRMASDEDWKKKEKEGKHGE